MVAEGIGTVTRADAALFEAMYRTAHTMDAGNMHAYGNRRYRRAECSGPAPVPVHLGMVIV